MLKKQSFSTKLLIVSLLVMALVFVFKINRLPPQIPLFYSRSGESEQLADFFWIFLLPFLSSSLVLANNFIVKKFYPNNILIEGLVHYLNLTIIISFTFIFLRIIFLVT